MSRTAPLGLAYRLDKVNAATGEFHAIVAHEAKDTAGEVFDYDSSKPHFEALKKRCLEESGGKKVAPLRVMHGLTVGGNVTEFEYDDQGRMVGMLGKITVPDVLHQAVEGTLCGVSMGGKKRRIGYDAATGGDRYTAIPNEISLVDLGAIPGTGIDMFNAAGGFSLEHGDGTVEQRPYVLGKAARTDDVSPAEGEHKYGDVTFADAENKKYPIDTEAHIRAAWSYINKPTNAAKYEDKGRAVKRKIIAAWKAKIDEAGPPALAKNTGFYIAADVVRLVGELAYLSELQKEEEAKEGDTTAGAVCDALDVAISALGDVAMAMLDEELGELPGEATEDAGDTADADMANAADAMKGLKGRVQRMHNMAVEMGAACAPMTDCTKAAAPSAPEGEIMSMKPEELKDLAKAVHAELGLETALAKAVGEALGLDKEDGALAKAIGAAVTPKLEELTKAAADLSTRVKALEDAPEPDKGVLRAPSKEHDGDPLAKAAREQSMLDDLAKSDPMAFMKLVQRQNGYTVSTTSGVTPIGQP